MQRKKKYLENNDPQNWKEKIKTILVVLLVMAIATGIVLLNVHKKPLPSPGIMDTIETTVPDTMKNATE